MMEITVGNMIAFAGVLLSMAGFGFGLMKWVQSQVREARADLEKDVTRLEARIETVRLECARREDIAQVARTVDAISHRLDTGVSGINGRIDQVLQVVVASGKRPAA